MHPPTSEPRYINQSVRELDGLPCAHPASVNLEVANLYYSLTRSIRPRLVVEIGCFMGFSTQHFAQALADNGFGQCISIDPFDFPVDAGNGLQDRQELAESLLKRSGLNELVRIVRAYSAQAREQIEEELRGGIDLLYIDGDHSIPGVFKDFNTYYNDVRPGGYILLHDIYPEMCACEGPRALLDRLARTGAVPRRLQAIELPTSDGYGVALLRKASGKPLSMPVAGGGLERIRSILARVMGWTRRSATGLPVAVPMRIIVHDDDTGLPIAGAVVDCPQLPVDGTRETDAAGLATLGCGRLLPYRYVLNISAEGYEPRSRVMADLTADPLPQEFDIRLKPLNA